MMNEIPAGFKKKIIEKREARKRSPFKKVSNDFIKSVIQRNNLVALKIVFYIATIIEKKDYATIDEKSLITIKINLAEMVKIVQTDMKYIKKYLKYIQQTSVGFVNEEKLTYESFSLFPYFKIEYANEFAEVKIFKRIADMFVEVKKNYTFLDCDSVQNFKCKHSLRLLPLLKHMDGYSKDCAPIKVMDIDELNRFFGTNYKRIVDIKKYILSPAKEELDSKSPLTFVFENRALPLYKKGRAYIHAVQIILVKNDSRSLFV